MGCPAQGSARATATPALVGCQSQSQNPARASSPQRLPQQALAHVRSKKEGHPRGPRATPASSPPRARSARRHSMGRMGMGGLLSRQDAACSALPCHTSQTSAPVWSCSHCHPSALPREGCIVKHGKGAQLCLSNTPLPVLPGWGEWRLGTQLFSRCPERTGWEVLCVVLAPAAL